MLRRSWRRLLDGKPYLDLDVVDHSLSFAIYELIHKSAWGKWYAAQHLANGNPISELFLMQTAASMVHDHLMNGRLAVRGRPTGQTLYEAIPRDVWRKFVLWAQPHPGSLWRVYAVPGGTITPDSIKQSPYDSLTVDPRAFCELWPRKYWKADRIRKKLLGL